MEESISQKPKTTEQRYADLADELLKFDKIRRPLSPEEQERRDEIVRQLRAMRSS